ncbi:uncharacterized protein LOC129612823 [Condylostylus longicornis]|uniref:uncharacterized protein LOC129612823 n=1 Tax=Condylostylus longicornis TaxID=2530218 RepID=UPI00244DA2AD|nr:uncharacterized protein LOC129612823 [Condylostylus longicornis]
MGTKSPGGPQRCRLILHRCLAIQLCKSGHAPDDFWMYDSGYMIFQNFLAANAQCWWNVPLTTATRSLKYAGHVAPGMLLVTGEPCALEVIRGSYARGVLKPPATYVISSVGDIDDCIVTPTMQGQFTPLPEALCDVIMNLTTKGQSATIENLRINLGIQFPHMTTPGIEVIYDTLAQLMQEAKIYQTAKGYFIVTPERRRSRSRPKMQALDSYKNLEEYEQIESQQEARTILMTNSEALHSLYGEISTERDGDLTHQCIQTNLADVICGGNPNDKIIYPRTSKRRSASFPTPRSLDRRHSLRLFGSSKRLQKCASTRSLSKTYAQSLTTDSSSSEYQSTDSSSAKKASLLFRLFRRSSRSKQRKIETYSGQFPPVEWFNSRTVHLHSIGTQTTDQEIPTVHTLSNSTFYDGSEYSQRSSTLPKRHRRHLSGDSIFALSSRDCSPLRRNSPAYSSSSLPRSTHSVSPMSTNVQNGTQYQSQQSSNICVSSSTTYQSSIAKAYGTGNETTFNKHIYEQQNRLKTSTKKLKAIDNHNKISSSGRNLRQSGHINYENGKTESVLISGPSSIDSGKISLNKQPTSDNSSLEFSENVNVKNQQISPTRSILILNRSPRSSFRHSNLRNNSVKKSETNGYDHSTNSSTIKFENVPIGKNSSSSNGISNSASNSSIMLQVTTNGSQSNIPSTKIFVQNSPVRSVITLENRKLLDSANVYIINNETTTNEKGEITKNSFTRQKSNPLDSIKLNSSMFESDTNSEAYDSLSAVSDTSKNQNDSISIQEKPDPLKFTKNTNNDTAMNNSRILPLKLSQNGSNGIIYKNYLKNDLPQSVNSEENISEFCKAGSVGNLGFYEKNINDLNNKINSNDLKNLRFESASSLNSKSLLNTPVDSLANILQKQKLDVESEPNLTNRNNEKLIKNDNFMKTIDKNIVDYGLNSTKDNNDELYNFPSLTDLSFNFTSLAAKKILQGVSLNSVDTLVELNLANIKDKEKQKNNTLI